MGSNFRTLIRAFMEPGRPRVPDERVEQLLVDAFLEDLRRAYRRTGVRGRRRTAYPVLLVDAFDVGGSGFRFIRLVGAARDRAGGRLRQRRPFLRDPLLIVAAGGEAGYDVLAAEVPIDHTPQSAGDPVFAYDSVWLADMEQHRRSRSWFLPLMVTRSERPSIGAKDELVGSKLPRARRPMTGMLAVGVLVVASIVVAVDVQYRHCNTWWWQPQLDREPGVTGDQCIGLAPDGHPIFRNELGGKLAEVEARIHRTNLEIVESGDEYHTVVYLSALSAGDHEGYDNELEQLRGIEVAQDEHRRNWPVRVLLANAGDNMKYAAEAAASIVAYGRDDPTLAAVLGLGISKRETREAMLRLCAARIPMIGTLLSATDLAENTCEYYRQVGPANRREAEVVAHYADAQGATHAVIYYSSDPDDLYSGDLRMQARDAFHAVGITVDEKGYRAERGGSGSDIGLLGREACELPDDDVLFYAGRAEDLPALLGGMKAACDQEYPKIISGDDVTRYLLTGALENFPKLTIDYVSFASSLAWGTDCGVALEKVSFLIGYARHFGRGVACERTLDGSAILAYDSLAVFVEAVRYAPRNGGYRATPDGVLNGLNKISSKANGTVAGAGGTVDFATIGDGVPTDKAILILRATGAADPTRRLLCGRLDSANPPPDRDRCPGSAGG